jgi:DNA polymerase-3 subunit delta'
MGWDEIAGQARAVRQLRTALERGQPHHAYLLTGPAGVGKDLLSRLFAQAANCEAAAERRPCGVCISCSAIARGSHPDVQWVRPQSELVARGVLSKADFEAAPSRDIRVDEVRQLARRLSLAAATGRRKVAVLEPADALNERAQNALLKTLEEPPPATSFVLVTAHADVLLPTVRSRCQRVQLQPLPDELIAQLLERHGVPAAEAQARAAAAHGSLGQALALTAEELHKRGQVRASIDQALQSPDEREALDLAEAFADRERAEELAQQIREILHLRLVQFAPSPGEPAGPQRLLRGHDLCDRVVEALEQNGNGRLQLERLLLGLRELGAPAAQGGARG